jgi:hypothetical protein
MNTNLHELNEFLRNYEQVSRIIGKTRMEGETRANP